MQIPGQLIRLLTDYLWPVPGRQDIDAFSMIAPIKKIAGMMAIAAMFELDNDFSHVPPVEGSDKTRRTPASHQSFLNPLQNFY
jgi:hypothetical protein